ncbi:hypothetical protein CSOJ01_15680 [Colletotrichum sojae]|uniref:Uncharacterized protein n=1 Tax=Colletotrichum sojae TaxID=2175907 RepID=A0A8H6MIF7_9PEZI|nr:hypothetical protein CSOJ01_15680 [Colletotrichum sojae]
MTETYPGLLAELKDNTLYLDVFRYHRGILTADDWEGKLYTIICEPHFSFVPCKLSSDDKLGYKRFTWIEDDGITPVSEEFCSDLLPRFPTTLPFVSFNGFVETQTFLLADNPEIGLDEITRNSSAVFKVWSRFPSTEHADTPQAGWYPNYVYALLPKCKPHLKGKCEALRANTTPYRKQGKKAYVTGYFHGFCHREAVLSEHAPYNPLVFLPVIEISKIDWATGEGRPQAQPGETPTTPRVPETPSRGKGRVVFDPLAQMSADTRAPRTPSKGRVQDSDATVDDDDPFVVNGLQSALAIQSKRSGESDDNGEDSDGPSPTKKTRHGSLRSRKKGI